MDQDGKNSKEPALRFRGFEGEWEEKKLGEIVDVYNGRDYKELSEGNVPVYGTGGYMLSVNAALSSTEDAIGIGRKGTIDKPFILKAPFWTVDTLFYTIPKDQFDLNFVFDIFQIIDWKKKDESTGVPSLSKTMISETDIRVPSYPEQKMIGRLLYNVNQFISLQQQKLNKLEDFKKAMLDKMFPQKGSMVPEIRFKGFTGNWKKYTLEEITERFDNLRIPITSNLRVSGRTPYYGANGIQDYVDGYTHDGEFVLLAEDGANDPLNYPVFFVQGKIWVNNHAHVLQGKPFIVDNRFLAFAIGQLSLGSLLVGGSRPKLNAGTMMNLQIAIPTLIEQQQIGQFFSHLDRLISLHRQKLEKLQSLKKAMLGQMFPAPPRQA